MSFLKVPIAESDASISRPVVLEVCRQIMNRTNIPEDTRIVFKGDAESILQPGSEIGADKKALSNPQLSGNSQLYVEITETPMLELITVEDTMKDTTQHLLFNDDKLGIIVAPIKKHVDVLISFRYRSESKTYAQKWRDQIWANVANQRDLDLHTVTYSYPFPPEFITLLKYFYSLRENIAGYGDTFSEYFEAYRESSLTGVSSLSGDNVLIYKPETQTRILGWYDFQGAPEKADKDGESSTWISSFSYKFQYEKPTHCFIRYPVAIHNQLVDQRLFGRMQKMIWERYKSYSGYTLAQRHFESDAIISRATARHPEQYRIPNWDDIAYTQYVPHTKTLFSTVIEIEEDTKILFNLKDLINYGFHPDVLDYIEQEGYQWITKPYACMLNVALYRNENLTDPKNLTIDKDLNVIANDGTNIRKVNRVRISYYDNIKQVMPEALVRLNNYRKALSVIVLAGDTKAGDIYRLKPRVDLTWLLDIIKLIGTDKRTEYFFDYNRVLDRATVQVSHVRAMKEQ